MGQAWPAHGRMVRRSVVSPLARRASAWQVEGVDAVSKRTKRIILIAVFFGLPVLAMIGVAWTLALWSDWRAGMVLLTVGVTLLAVYAIRGAL